MPILSHARKQIHPVFLKEQPQSLESNFGPSQDSSRKNLDPPPTFLLQWLMQEFWLKCIEGIMKSL